MPIDVKICGLKTNQAVEISCSKGARMCGFVFYPPSPRFVDIETVSELTSHVPIGVEKVGLVVNADNSWLASFADTGIDCWQLHGQETPERIAKIKAEFGFPIIKAIPIAEKFDLSLASEYDDIADLLLFDAKPLPGASRPGGNAQTFDWEIIKGAEWKTEWMLAGGLNVSNLEAAIEISGASVVDVASGVEDKNGEKSIKKISDFLSKAKQL